MDTVPGARRPSGKSRADPVDSGSISGSIVARGSTAPSPVADSIADLELSRRRLAGKTGATEIAAQLFFMAFMIMPMMAVTIAPEAPPPTSWRAIASMSMPPPPPESAGINAPSKEPPATPPTAPATVLPVGPRVIFLSNPPAALPLKAPTIKRQTL
jgi:hypothetical protein